MLRLTKFLGLHNEVLNQNIPMQDNIPMGVLFLLCVNILSIPQVASSRTSSLSYIPPESIFRILIIAFIGSSMCLSMKI